jgi:hypothetical protein
MPVNEKGRYLKVFKCGQLVYGNDTTRLFLKELDLNKLRKI